MSIYTKTLDDIYFLNDKNLVSSIDGDTTVNAVPTMELVHDSYQTLSGMSDKLSTYLGDITATTDLTTGSETYVSVITKIGQDKAKLVLTATTLLSSHVKDLDTFVNDVSSKLDNKVWLSANTLSNEISTKVFVKDIASTDASFKNGKYTDLSVVKISLTDYEADVKAGTLNNNCLYIISSNYIDAFGQVMQNLIMSNDIVPSQATTQHYVDAVSSTISSELLTKINTVNDNITTEINKLVYAKFTTNAGEILTAVSESNGVISAEKRALTSADIPTLTENKIENLTTDLNNLSSKYVQKTEYTDLFNARIHSFEYKNHEIQLSVGTKPLLTINTAEFEQGRFIETVNIGPRRQEPTSDVQSLNIQFKLEDGSFKWISIPITQLANLYDGSANISITNDGSKYVIDVKNTVALRTDISSLNYANTITDSKAKLLTQLKEDKGVISYVTKDVELKDIIDINSLSCNNILDGADFKIITQLEQNDGKLSYGAEVLSVKHIIDYENVTNGKINTAIQALDSEYDAGRRSSSNEQQFITKIKIVDGKIVTESSSKAAVTSADIVDFSTAVDNLTTNKINTLTSNYQSQKEAGIYQRFITGLQETGGIINSVSSDWLEPTDISGFNDAVTNLVTGEIATLNSSVSAGKYEGTDYQKFFTKIEIVDGKLSDDACIRRVLTSADISSFSNATNDLIDIKVNELDIASLKRDNIELSNRITSAATYIAQDLENALTATEGVTIGTLSALFVKLSCAFNGTYPS